MPHRPQQCVDDALVDQIFTARLYISAVYIMALRSSFRPSRYVQRDRATPSRAEGPASRRRRRCGLLLQMRSSGVVGPTVHPRGLLLRHLALMCLSYLYHSTVKLCFQFSYNVTPDTTRQDRPVVSDVGCELGSSLCSWHAGE